MKLSWTAGAAIGLLFAATPVAGQQRAGQDIVDFLQRISGQYLILLTRSFVDFTYDALTIEPGSGNIVISGMTLYPEFDWDENFECIVEIDRVFVGGLRGFDVLSSSIEINGLSAPTTCFDPEIGGMLGVFGYEDGLVAESASIDISYDLPSAAADVTLHVAVADAADLSVTALFDYLWIRFPTDGGDEPYPVAYLGEAEIVLENQGLFERLEPMLTQQFGDLSQAPAMVEAILGPMLSDGGSRALAEEEQVFVRTLATELQGFVQAKDRLAISISPEESIYLDEEIFTDPAEMIQTFRPKVSRKPLAYQRVIPPDLLALALQGGDDLSDDDRLRAGKALISGLGAPRALSEGRSLLQPLADSWNGEAALLLAEAELEFGNEASAYANALKAMASGEMSALGIADRAETRLDTAEILTIQINLSAEAPSQQSFSTRVADAIAQGDVGGLRQAGLDVSVGRSVPRNFITAYTLATLAAAAGDKAALNLRARLDRRFGTQTAWREAADRAASDALELWTGGLAETVSAPPQ